MFSPHAPRMADPIWPSVVLIADVALALVVAALVLWGLL